MTVRVAGRIERYVVAQSLIGLGAAVAVLGAVVVLIDFVELSRNLAGKTDIGFLTTLGLALLKSPSVILQLLPFVFLFGVLAAFVTLNRRSELVAIRAAGVSAWRFIAPGHGPVPGAGPDQPGGAEPHGRGHGRRLRERPGGGEPRRRRSQPPHLAAPGGRPHPGDHRRRRAHGGSAGCC